jgi:hypothetical protein
MSMHQGHLTYRASSMRASSFVSRGIFLARCWASSMCPHASSNRVSSAPTLKGCNTFP